MPRTKGAKGKKTLAKEMGMTLEQYEKYLRGEKIELPKKELSDLNLNPKKEELIKKENLNPSELEPDEITLPEKKDEEEKINKEKIDELKNNLIESNKSKAKNKSIISCERCHEPITGPVPFKINLNYLTTLPDYHRQTESEHGRILLCDKCLKSLNKLVDEFLYNEGEGIPLKYGQKEYRKGE